MLQALRARLDGLQRGERLPAPVMPDADGEVRSPSAGWTLGVADIDRHLRASQAAGLDVAGVHEIRAGGAGEASPLAGFAENAAAAQAFALMLAVRRLAMLHAAGDRVRPILWVTPTHHLSEVGVPYGPGLERLGLPPERLLIVEVRRDAEALWAMEEALRSAAVALVIGCLPEVELTPARRLALAAARHAVPCLLVSDARSPPAAATQTRWRVAACPGPRHPLIARAPGAISLRVSIERARAMASSLSDASWSLVWCHETSRLRPSAELCHRPAAPGAFAGSAPRGDRRRHA